MLLCWKYYIFIFLKCLRKRNDQDSSFCYFHSINVQFLYGLHLSTCISQQSKHYSIAENSNFSPQLRTELLCGTHSIPRVYQLNVNAFLVLVFLSLKYQNVFFDMIQALNMKENSNITF